MATRGASKQLMLALVRVDTSDTELKRLLGTVDPAVLVENAIAHRVPGLVHQRLVEAGLADADTYQTLEQERRRALAKHLVALDLVARIDASLTSRWVVLKGPALARMYERPDARTYQDLDILVSRSDFDSVLDQLLASGFGALNQNWSGFVEQGVAEVPLDGGSLVVDLHWSAVALREQRSSMDLATDEALQRRQAVARPGGSFPCLDPVDTLLHLCLHTGLGGARRLLWMVDIDRTVRFLDIEWDEFVRRAGAAGAALMSHLVLERAKETLHSPIPRSALAGLRTSRMWPLADQLMRRVPRSAEQLRLSWGPGLFLSAARDSLPQSARALRQGLVNARDFRSDGESSLDWRIDSGGDAGREEWLGYVRSGRL